MRRLKPGAAPAHDDPEERKALEQRARDALAPSAPEVKGRWPFPVKSADENQAGMPMNPDQTGRRRT